MIPIFVNLGAAVAHAQVQLQLSGDGSNPIRRDSIRHGDNPCTPSDRDPSSLGRDI